MTNGKRNRAAGHGWERQIVRVLREIGFPHVVTSRSESRSRDNQKIDIVNKDELKNGRLPYNIQAKNTVGTVKYPVTLAALPKDKDIINVIFHKQTRKSGNKFIPTQNFAILYLEDFIELMKERNERSTNGQIVVSKNEGGIRERLLSILKDYPETGIQDIQGVP